MYQVTDRQVGEQFCLLVQRARKSKKILRLRDEYVWGYLEETNHLGNQKSTEPIEVL